MIKDYFSDKTEVMEIKVNKLIKYNENEEEKLNLLAQKISDETNVPKSSIFTGKWNCRIENWHKIDDKYYYFKPMKSPFVFFNELLGEFISIYFDLESVHYNIAKVIVKDEEEQYGLLSKNFCNPDYTYKCLFDYISENNKLHFFEKDLSILDKIRVICKTEEEFRLLQDDLKKLVIRHFYNTQSDGGNGKNIMLKKTPSGIRLAPLYDYESAYITDNSYEDIYRLVWDIGELNITDTETQNLFRNDPRFQELLYKLMDADITSFLTEVEDTHKIIIPAKQKEHYKTSESKVKKLVLENKLIK